MRQKAKPILVIGDIILDVYHYGSASHLSVETPTIVAKAECERFFWGGAGLVARNILALGGRVFFISLLGDDDFGRRQDDFTHPRLKKLFITETGRKTTVKERFWAGEYILLRWDRLDNRDSRAKTRQTVLSLVKRHLPASDKLVIADYRHGLITKDLAARLVLLARKLGKPVYVDSQMAGREGNHSWYRGADLIALSEKEALSVDPNFSSQNLASSLERLAKILDTLNVVVKLGARGSAAFVQGHCLSTPAPKVRAVDPSGAGDAFLGSLALAPFPPGSDDLKRANQWAAASTTFIGTEPPRHS